MILFRAVPSVRGYWHSPVCGVMATALLSGGAQYQAARRTEALMRETRLLRSVARSEVAPDSGSIITS